MATNKGAEQQGNTSGTKKNYTENYILNIIEHINKK